MKSNLTMLFGFFIALSGLVSCSPDKSVQDRLDIRAPKFVRGETSMTWDVFLLNAKKELDLADTIEFPNAPLANLNVTVKCGFGSEMVTNAIDLPLQNKLSVSELFSDKLLANFSPDSAPVCSLDFVARNASGSTRTFEIQSVQILDKISAKGLRLNSALSYDNSSPVIVQTGDLKATLQMDDWLQHDQFRIQCADVSFKRDSSANSIRTADFDFYRPQIETDEESFNAHPVQRCRAFSYAKGKRIAISDSFTLLYDDRTPRVVTLPERQGPGLQPLTLDLNLLYREYRIDNASGIPLRFMIPKSTPTFDMTVYFYPCRDCGGGRAPENLPAIGVVEILNKDLIVSESVESWVVELKPLKQLNFRILARIQGHQFTKLAGVAGFSREPYFIFLQQKSYGEDVHIALPPIETREKMLWGSPDERNLK